MTTEFQSAWPVMQVDVPQESVKRISELMRTSNNIGVDRSGLHAAIPSSLALTVAQAMRLDGVDRLSPSQKGVAAEVWRLAKTLAVRESMNTHALHRLFLMDRLFANFKAGNLTTAEVTSLAQEGGASDRCYELLSRWNLAQLANGMRETALFEPWQCDWLALQAMGAYLGGGAPIAPVPAPVKCFKAQMPLQAAAMAEAYAVWLDRKSWCRGEVMSGAPDPSRPAFERPNHFMSSWLVTVKLTTGLDFTMSDTLDSVTDRLCQLGRHSLIEQMFVGLCDDQMGRILDKAGGRFQHYPDWADGGGYWGWRMGLNLETTGALTTQSRDLQWFKDPSLMYLAKEFIRDVLCELATYKPLSWFYERPVAADGYREIQPGWPSEPYFEGSEMGLKLLSEDQSNLVIWGKSIAQGPIIDSPIPVEEFAVEVWNKDQRRVDAKVSGIVYTLEAGQCDLVASVSTLMQSAYSISQQHLLFFIDSLRQQPDVQTWAANGPVVVIEAWERHAQSEPGIGAMALQSALRHLRTLMPGMGHVMVNVDPLQFSPIAGGEPEEIQTARATACQKIAQYTRKVATDTTCGQGQILLVEQTLNGDIEDVLRDVDLPEKLRIVLQCAVVERQAYGA